MSLISLAEGSVFAGRYRIVRSIAQGGMGAVYEVVHTETQRRRALKVMLPNMLQSQDMRDRFRQEACVTANIESDYIVDVLDAGIDEKTQMPFLVMELLRGEELDKRLKREGRLDPREAVTYLHHVALALDKTHRASIVHRDLKPGTCSSRSGGRVVSGEDPRFRGRQAHRGGGDERGGDAEPRDAALYGAGAVQYRPEGLARRRYLLAGNDGVHAARGGSLLAGRGRGRSEYLRVRREGHARASGAGDGAGDAAGGSAAGLVRCVVREGDGGLA
jgi:serine/threonine protein kinase